MLRDVLAGYQRQLMKILAQFLIVVSNDGGIVKRHQDQIHLRSLSPPPAFRRILPLQLQEENLGLSILNQKFMNSGSCVPSETQNKIQSGSPNLPRRSSHFRKPVARLDL